MDAFLTSSRFPAIEEIVVAGHSAGGQVVLVRHDVRILIGDADTTSASLDQTCGANLQGPRRYHRGRTLVRFMDELYAGHAHREMIVPGVGHSSRSMWLSGVGAGALFGN